MKIVIVVATVVLIAQVSFAKNEAPQRDPFATNLPKKIEEPKVVVSPAPPIKEKVRAKVRDTRIIKPVRTDRRLKSPSNHKDMVPKLTVSGIIWNSRRPQAIVNSRVVDIGDVVNGVEVMDITKTGVQIRYGRGTKSQMVIIPYGGP